MWLIRLLEDLKGLLYTLVATCCLNLFCGLLEVFYKVLNLLNSLWFVFRVKGHKVLKLTLKD